MPASRWVPHSLPPPPLPLRFATKERDGLLLYNGRFNEKHDFVALEVIQEQVQLTFSAGDPTAPRPPRLPESLCLSALAPESHTLPAKPGHSPAESALSPFPALPWSPSSPGSFPQGSRPPPCPRSCLEGSVTASGTGCS